MRKPLVLGSLIGALLLGAAVWAAGPIASSERVQQGEYLAVIMDCGGCHTPGALIGRPDGQRPLAGSDVGFEIPGLGVFYPPNLTSDRETGLGGWSQADIVKAVRTGERPDGRLLVPVMPYHSYSRLTDGDAEALAAYLKALKPVRHQAPAMVGQSDKPSAPYLALKVPEPGAGRP